MYVVVGVPGEEPGWNVPGEAWVNFVPGEYKPPSNNSSRNASCPQAFVKCSVFICSFIVHPASEVRTNIITIVLEPWFQLGEHKNC